MLPLDHPTIPRPRIGVLLVNLGTPDAADTRAVRRYLAEFLSDRRVVEIPQLLWQPILRGAILTTRPKKSAHAYQQVWTDAGSPLAAVTRAQAAAHYHDGLASIRRYGEIGLPTLADAPEVSVELIDSTADPGGVADLGVPAVAPAIATALFAAGGTRWRHLPFRSA